ncbi:hypothetical protein [Longispora albida]|uniref:hypothetical protein n=1 Tax=Longispora albida TaxID=203523 RepID=UPI0003A922C0|nr:hypothetical protein [Longispora albida]
MRRVPVIALAGALGLSGVLLAGSPALAETTGVTFSGGCGLLGVGAHSRPDVTALTVTTMSAVRFVNGMTVQGDLVLPGGVRYTLQPRTYLDVPIASGPAEALLEPACGLGLLPTYQKVTIQVEAPPAEPAPSPPETSATAPAPAGTPAPPASPAARPAQSQAPAATVPSAAVPHASAPPPAPAQPPAAAAPAQPPAAVAKPPASQAAPAEPITVEPVAAGQVPERASSLLALVAVVFVIGVAAAAIRAIAAQRSGRVIRPAGS